MGEVSGCKSGTADLGAVEQALRRVGAGNVHLLVAGGVLAVAVSVISAIGGPREQRSQVELWCFAVVVGAQRGPPAPRILIIALRRESNDLSQRLCSQNQLG